MTGILAFFTGFVIAGMLAAVILLWTAFVYMFTYIFLPDYAFQICIWVSFVMVWGGIIGVVVGGKDD